MILPRLASWDDQRIGPVFWLSNPRALQRESAGVLLAPILPRITDSIASLVAGAAVEHDAMWLGSSALRVRLIIKNHYFGFVEDEFADRLTHYERAYPLTNAPKPYQDPLTARMNKIGE
jgi:hypothetical protein